jgi:hypothetical protein
MTYPDHGRLVGDHEKSLLRASGTMDFRRRWNVSITVFTMHHAKAGE